MGKRASYYESMVMDRSWMRWKPCFFCGRHICVNNWPDKRSRTPKFQGFTICPWCNPYVGEELLSRTKYVTAMSRVLVYKMGLKGPCEYPEGCKCFRCSAVKLNQIHQKDELERSVTPPHHEIQV